MYIRTIYVYIYDIRTIYVQYTYIYISKSVRLPRENFTFSDWRGEEERQRRSLRWFFAEAEEGGGAGEGGASEERRKEGDTACYYLAGGGKRRLRWAHLASQDIFPPFMALGPSFFQPLRAALITAGLKGWYLWYTGAF